MCRAIVAIGECVANRSFSVAGVRIMPGLTQFTRMPCGAPSAASCLVIATIPPLVAVWAMRALVIDPLTPAVLPTSSTLGAVDRRSSGQACFVGRKTRSSSLRSTRLQSA